VLKIVWFIPRPEQDIEELEALYQGQHVLRGMRQENLRAFRISRGLYPQPQAIREITGTAEPGSFRFSEGYWDTFADIEACYRSPHGLAALADGMLNASPRLPRGPQPVFFAAEQEFETRSRLQFDIFRGRYTQAAPVKLFVFVRLRRGSARAFDAGYAALAPEIGAVDGLGPHMLSRRQEHTLTLGRASQWPPAGVDCYDRVAEYYFPRQAATDAFLESPAFEAVASLAREHGQALLPVAAEPQEVFFTTTGQQPLSEGWRAFYREQG
jgi:hypothetical protein